MKKLIEWMQGRNVKHKRIRWLLLMLIGIIIGWSMALQLGAHYLWVSFGLGIAFTVFGIASCLRAKRAAKNVVSSILCAALASAQVFGSSAGLFCWMNEGYCPPVSAASEEEPIHGVTLQIIVDLDGPFVPAAPFVKSPQARIVSIQHTPESAMVSAEAANAVLAGWGIQWTGSEAEQYATNGQPATAADVPFRISYESSPPRIILYPDLPQALIVVETATRIGDGADWAPILATSIPVGVLIHVEDLTRSGNGFYRVRHVTAQEFQATGAIVLGIGIGLLVGGGYVCYRVAKCAAKRARDRQTPPTNAPPPMAEMRLR